MNIKQLIEIEREKLNKLMDRVYKDYSGKITDEVINQSHRLDKLINDYIKINSIKK